MSILDLIQWFVINLILPLFITLTILIVYREDKNVFVRILCVFTIMSFWGILFIWWFPQRYLYLISIFN